MQSDSQTSKGYHCSIKITDSSDPGIFSLYFPGTRKCICASLADALIFTTAHFFSTEPLYCLLHLYDPVPTYLIYSIFINYCSNQKNRIRLSYPALAFHFLFFAYFCLTKYGLHQHHIKHRSPSYAEQCTLLPFM